MNTLRNLHPSIQNELLRMEKARPMLYALSPHLCRVERIALEVLEDIPHTVFRFGSRIALSFDIKTFSDAIPLLTALAHAGWRREGKMEKTDTVFRWQLRYEVRDGLTIELEMDGRVETGDRSTARCRRVQIGVETKEIPVYEIVCEDAEMLSEPSKN
jgi:hypothetical protein